LSLPAAIGNVLLLSFCLGSEPTESCAFSDTAHRSLVKVKNITIFANGY